MSYHIGAKKGDIADTILLPGDPLRAKYIAEKFLDNAVCYNKVRSMFGYTGEYNGKKISVQGTGMGIPSCSIYINELINEYGVKTLIRVGSAGGLQKNLPVRTVILPLAASTDSSMNRLRINDMSLAPYPDGDLLFKAYEYLKEKKIKFKVGGVISSDIFYDDKNLWKLWASYGILAVEMESSELFTLAMKFNVKSLSLLTISNNLVTGEVLSSEEIEKSLDDMITCALNIVT